MRISHKKHKPEPKKIFFHNEGIAAPEVLVLAYDGHNLGVLKTAEAVRLAREAEMDLVLINPKTVPPVAKITDFGQFKYQQEKEDRIRQAHAHVTEVKGIRLSLRIGAHDLEIRKNQAIKFLNEGDKVREDMIVAMVGGNSIRAKTDGIVLSIKNTPGQIVSSQDAVVKMLNPQEFRLVGRIAEDKGLKDIREGQTVLFTVDAFGTKEYRGVIDSISPTSRQSDIVFSISDKREEKQFDVKAKYDVDAYPELKNGMSAKMWVYIK